MCQPEPLPATVDTFQDVALAESDTSLALPSGQ
jgi:hypothetical protein